MPRILRLSTHAILTVAGLLLLPLQASAHRGFGAAELGVPIGTTIGLAIVCYWVVVLWPTSKKKRSGPGARLGNEG